MMKMTAGAADRAQIVSFDDEPLILVSPDDAVQGYSSKAECHNGMGLLHRAFSVFLFNARGEVLLQQRSASKRLWPMFWSNSCCSHPRRGETMENAARRRIREELAVETPLSFLYKFIYQATYKDDGSEHELCSVFVGVTDAHPHVNPTEIASWRYVEPAALDRVLIHEPARYTPWLQLEWPRLRQQHWAEVESLLAAQGAT